MNFYNNFKHKNKKEKGSLFFEFILSMMIALAFIIVIYDIVLYTGQKEQVQEFANVIERQVSVQGGTSTSKPKGFENTGRYIIIKDIKNSMDNFCELKHLTNCEIVISNGDESQKVYINSSNNTNQSLIVDYLKPLKMTFYTTTQLGIFDSTKSKTKLGYTVKLPIRDNRTFISEWKQDYDTWGGEK